MRTCERPRASTLREAGLGIGQLFAIIFGFLITSGLIFLFGIWVGRDVAERRLAQEERVVRVPVPAQPTPSSQESGVDLAFYQHLKEKAYQRLQETPVAEAAASPTAVQVVPVLPPATPTSTAAPVAVKATPHPTVAPRLKAAPPPEHRDDWADAGWTVQVNATTNPAQATELARTLRAKGYDAYTVQAPMRGQTWYRVRVGRFASREKAKELEARLKSDEGLENAYTAPQ